MNLSEDIILRISFEFYKGNEAIFDFIKKLADKHRIKGYLYREDDQVFIIASSNLENIQKFADELGKLLPLSLFMSNASTEVVYNLPEFLEDKFKIKHDINIIPQNLSICPSCLMELLDENNRRFYFPFISCNYCGNQYAYIYNYPFERENTLFKYFQMCNNCKKEFSDAKSRRYEYPLISCHDCLTPIYLKKGENERFGFDAEKTVGAFNTAAGVIKKGNLLKVYTGTGLKLIGLINKENIEKIRSALNIDGFITVMFTNFSNLNKYLVLSNEEINALASQEKPILYLKPTENFKELDLVSNGLKILKTKLADDVILLLLAYHLKNEGIDYIFITDFEEYQQNITDFELNADLPIVNKQKDLELIVIDKKILIKDGEKGLFPNIIKARSTGNLSIGNGYAVLDLGGEYLIDKKDRILYQLKDFVDEINEIRILQDEYEPEIDIKYNKITKYADWEGAIYSVLAEKNLLDKAVIGLYFSTNSKNNLIAIKTEKGKLKPAVEIKPIPYFSNHKEAVKYVFEAIRNSSQQGSRLINNFFKKFPEFEEKLKNIEVKSNENKTKNIAYIFQIIAYILEIENLEKNTSLENTLWRITDKALNFQGNRGVRIDFLLDEIDGKFYLDWQKIIQSIISYKIAGTEADMLAFSLLDEFSNWLINQVATIYSKLKIENIVLTGDIFINPLITPKLINSFSKHNLLINRKLPIDYKNIPFGGIFVK